MAEYSANAIQTVNPGESVVFTDSPVPCNRGLIRHRDDTGNFLLSGWLPNRFVGCCCKRRTSADYLIDFGANISLPTGGTAGDISLAIAIDGASIPASTMTVTAAEDGVYNISRAINADIWRGCCETISVVNTSDQAVQIQNANIIFSRPDLAVSY